MLVVQARHCLLCTAYAQAACSGYPEDMLPRRMVQMDCIRCAVMTGIYTQLWLPMLQASGSCMDWLEVGHFWVAHGAAAGLHIEHLEWSCPT